MTTWRRALLALACAAASAAALAAYPDRPVKVVLGFAAGGGSDILLRKIAPAIGDALGQPLVIENQPGAGGNLAMAAVAHAAPDGYTLLMGSPGLATNASLYANLGFDPARDFAPVAMVGSVQNVLLVRRDLPVASVAELIAWAKKNPGKLNVASPGVGTSLHLAAELFMASSGTRMVHVPYKGGGQAMTDLMGGQVDVMFNVLPSALPQIRAGTVRALAVTGAQREASLPEVPTMIESGIAGYTAVTWNGIVAPAATPREVVVRVNDAVNAALRRPDVQQALREIGQDVLVGTPEEFGTLLREETRKWKRTIEAAGVKAP